MTVRTGSSTFVDYIYEDSYGGSTGSNTTQLFGKNTNANGIEFTNNQTAVPQLYTTTYESYLYNKNAGSCSIEYTMSNPFMFSSMFNNPTLSGSDPYTYIWNTDDDVNRDIRTMMVQFGLEQSAGSDDDVLQTASGVVTSSLNIKTALEQPVSVTQSLAWSQDAIIDDAELPTPGTDSDFTPYNFVNGSVAILPAGGGSFTVGTIQDLDFTVNINSELLFEVGDASAVDAYRKLFEMTGKVNVAFEDSTYIQFIKDRAEQTSMTFTFSNGQSGTDERTITIVLSGVGFSSRTTTFAPGEPVFEDFNFQARTAIITAINSTGTFLPVQ